MGGAVDLSVSMNTLSFAYDGLTCIDVPKMGILISSGFVTFDEPFETVISASQRVVLGYLPFHFVIQLLF